jgi:curved DNA-binding protein CbpA
MNYYEELGIPKTASAEEVRRAYRSLARLVHPDQQSDEALRRLAGIQMARLNEILKTLTEPKLRARYDDSLRRQARQAAGGRERMRAHRMAAEELAVSFNSERRWGRLAWPAAGLLGIGLIGLFLAQDAAVQHPSVDGEVAAGGHLGDEAGAWPVRTEGRPTVTDRKEGGAREPGGTKAGDFPNYMGPGERLLPPDYSDRRGRGGGTGSERTDGTPAGKFGGEWYFAKPAKIADGEGICPPMYIDVEISESRGEVRGSYSARYMVGERKISPFVEFEFAGTVREPAADLDWSGAVGAKGRVRLRLLSARSLRVEWSADQVGQEMGLASGMATLARREGY